MGHASRARAIREARGAKLVAIAARSESSQAEARQAMRIVRSLQIIGSCSIVRISKSLTLWCRRTCIMRSRALH